MATTRVRRFAVGGALGIGDLLLGTALPLVAVLLASAFVPLAFGELFALFTLFFGVGLVLVSVSLVTAIGRGWATSGSGSPASATSSTSSP